MPAYEDMTSRLTVRAAVAAFILILGCGSPRVARVEWPADGGPLAFLQDRTTTREDILLTLGVPSGQFEGERILTYLVWLDAKTNTVRVLPREYALDGTDPRVYALSPAVASLVLVFDARNVLQRHALVAGQLPE